MREKPIIICLVGASGCGKTTAAEHISKSLGLNNICSYTTRPMREGEKNGREHYFVGVEEMPDRKEMLAYTFFGGHHYWATKEQAKKDCVYVIDEVGVRSLVREFGDEYIILPFLIQRDKIEVDAQRKERDNERKPLGYGSFITHIENNGDLGSFLFEVVSQVNSCIYCRPWVENWYRVHKKDFNEL